MIVLLLVCNLSYAGKFENIVVNRSNQKEQSKDYFIIEVRPQDEDERLTFFVRVQANPEDVQTTSSLASLELVERGKRVGQIPIHRQPKPDGGGRHVIKFHLTRSLAANSKLILVQLTGKLSGKNFRIDLGSYVEPGAKETG